MPAGSSSDRPAMRPGPTTAAKATRGPILRFFVTGASVCVISRPDLALPWPAALALASKDIDHGVGHDAVDLRSGVVHDHQPRARMVGNGLEDFSHRGRSGN